MYASDDVLWLEREWRLVVCGGGNYYVLRVKNACDTLHVVAPSREDSGLNLSCLQSTRDPSICNETRVVDLRKALRMAKTPHSHSPPTECPPSAGAVSVEPGPSHGMRRRSTIDVGLLGNAAALAPPPSAPGNVPPSTRSDRSVGRLDAADSNTPKRMSTAITVASICSVPDVAYMDYMPPGGHGEYTGAVTPRPLMHKPAVSVVLTNGTILCVDVEVSGCCGTLPISQQYSIVYVFIIVTYSSHHFVRAQTFTILSKQSNDSIQQIFGPKAAVISSGHPVTSSSVTSATVISKLDGYAAGDQEGFASDSSREMDSDDDKTSGSTHPSRPPSQRRTSSTVGSPRHGSVAVRRSSSMTGGDRRRSMAKIHAERRRKHLLATQAAPNLENMVLVSIAVVLGAFDRRMMVFRSYLPRLVPDTTQAQDGVLCDSEVRAAPLYLDSRDYGVLCAWNMQ